MKINGKEIVSNGMFAWDGDHKIYILQDDADIAELHAANRGGAGYETYPIEKLQEIWDKSCPLRFISTWKLERIVAQCEQAVFTD